MEYFWERTIFWGEEHAGNHRIEEKRRNRNTRQTHKANRTQGKKERTKHERAQSTKETKRKTTREKFRFFEVKT